TQKLFTQPHIISNSYYLLSSYVPRNYKSYLDGLCNKELVRQFSKTFEPPFYWIIFVVGALGNLLIVCSFTAVRNRLKTMTDVYLLNLAVADLIFSINYYASMLLLTCISVDRYIAIVHVIEAYNYKNKQMLYRKITCVFVWLASCFLALPEFLFTKVKNIDSQSTSCVMVYSVTDNNRTKILVLALQISVGFLLPLLVIVLCYSVIIRKLLQGHLCSYGCFCSQLPFSGYLSIEAGQANNATITNCEVMQSLDMAGQIVKCLAYTHCCLNPILYIFIGIRFQKDLFSLLQHMSCCLGLVNKSKLQQVPKRPSVMSDSDTTPVFSL
uniref:Chemokine (C-C motif) receptor 9b n=1 Tax=Cyprinus carpio TaxID=7962 RepID=A0A8C2PQ15_CYPCA